MQLADELPMIYTTCIMGFATFSYSKSGTFALFIGLALFSLAWFITVSLPSTWVSERGVTGGLHLGKAFYHMTKDPQFHQTAYGLLMCTIVFRCVYAMKFELTPALKERSAAKADAIMSQMWMMAFAGWHQRT